MNSGRVHTVYNGLNFLLHLVLIFVPVEKVEVISLERKRSFHGKLKINLCFIFKDDPNVSILAARSSPVG